MRILASTCVLLIAIIAGGLAVRNYVHIESSAAGPATAGHSEDDSQAPPAADRSELNILPEAERQYIWDIEQVALVLDRKEFPEIAAALARRDISRLLDRMADDLHATVPASDQELLSLASGVSWFESLKLDDSATATDQAGLIEYLLRQRDLFEQPSVQLRLMRLSPVDRSHMEGQWQGSMELRYWGESREGGPAEWVAHARLLLDRPAETAPWRIRACNFTDASFRHADRFLTREVSKERGLDPSRLHDNWRRPEDSPQLITGGVYLWDFNRDGHLDVLVTEPQRFTLYQGDGTGQFLDVTLACSLPRSLPYPGAEPGIADLDNDGLEDLILGNQLFHNRGGSQFMNVTGRSNLALPSDTAGIAVADYDRDGRVDLYVTRIASGHATRQISYFDYQVGPGNQLWRNLGEWQFENVTEKAGASGDRRSCYAACWLDVNDDGWPDLTIADEFGHPLLLVGSSTGLFESRSISQDFAGFCMGAAAGDLDGDGRIDLYMGNMYSKAGDRIIANLRPELYEPAVYRTLTRFVSGSELLRNGGDGGFEFRGRSAAVHGVGWAYGPSLVDLDNDGLLDIYATAGFQSIRRDEPDG